MLIGRIWDVNLSFSLKSPLRTFSPCPKAVPFQCGQHNTQPLQHFVSRSLGREVGEFSLWPAQSPESVVCNWIAPLYLSPPPPTGSNKKGQKHLHFVSTVTSGICIQQPIKSFETRTLGAVKDSRLQVEG